MGRALGRRSIVCVVFAIMSHKLPAAVRRAARPPPPAALVGLAVPPTVPRQANSPNLERLMPKQHHDHNELQPP
jgi:hypothetical protein